MYTNYPHSFTNAKIDMGTGHTRIHTNKCNKLVLICVQFVKISVCEEEEWEIFLMRVKFYSLLSGCIWRSLGSDRLRMEILRILFGCTHSRHLR